MGGGSPLIEQLKADNLPVIMWGAGSLSYQTRKYLFSQGVQVDLIWVDNADGGQCIDGIPVLPFDEVASRYKRFNVVCGHSRYDKVDEIAAAHSEINKIYCFVNLCYGQWNGIDTSFINAHLSQYEESLNLFDDLLSRECFISYLNCRNNENYEFLIPCCNETATYFINPFFKLTSDEVYLDVGAYDGETIREFLSVVDSYKKIIAIEPENQSYKKLRDYIQAYRIQRIETYNNGCWDSNTTLSFSLNEECSGVSEEGIELEVRRIDEQFANEDISLVKINYLNGLVETLKGAEEIVRRRKPRIVVTVGFDEWGLINIPKTIKEIYGDYRLGLRYASPMPARLILFAY